MNRLPVIPSVVGYCLLIVIAVSCAQPLRAQETDVAVEEEHLSLPPLTERGTIAHYPYMITPFGGLSDWSLHPGLNGAVSASVGWNKRWGTSFANSLSLMQADLLAPRLSYALGVHTSHLDWGPYTVNNAGLTALMGYQFSDRWEAYLFAQKSLVQSRLPLPYFLADDLGDKIGASLRYNVSPQFSLQLSVWEGRRPEPSR